MSDTDDQLPRPLQSLASDLAAPGPARPLNAAGERALIESALRGTRERAHGLSPSLRPLPKLHLPPTLKRPRRVLGVAAVVLIGSSAAATLYQGLGGSPSTEEAAPAAIAQPARQSASQAVAAPAPEAVPAQEAMPPSVEAPVIEAPPPARAAASSATPEDLLAKANRLRREGRAREAEAAYEEMVRREPGSISGYVARVALAELRLGRDPSSAVALLRAAQQQSPRGTLEVEIRRALANAYRNLGDGGRERSELEQLIALYPKGAAAEWARTRLRELQ